MSEVNNTTEPVERKERCENCRWWNQLKGLEWPTGTTTDFYGECRRYPPAGDDEGQFSFTQGHLWCGEFKAIELPVVEKVANRVADDTAAIRFVDSMTEGADGSADGKLYWHGWAILKAYLAGLHAGRKE